MITVLIQTKKMENKHISEELGEWQDVDSPFSTISAKMIDGEDNSSVVQDNFFTGSSVFPPGNHEDLLISNPDDDDHQHLEEPEAIHTPGGDGVRRWISLHVGVLQTEIFRCFRRFRDCGTCKVGLRSSAWIAGGVIAALLVSFWRRRVLVWMQRQLQLGSSRKSLLAIIDEKNKKINQLLLQIAQMHEMLLARRRVPVLVK